MEMNKNMIIVVALVVLVVVAGAQAFQLSSLKSKLDSGNVNLKTNTASSSVASTNTQSSLDSLPDMVGGC